MKLYPLIAMRDLLFEDLLDDLEKREQSAARKVVDDIEPEEPTVRMALSYQMYRDDFVGVYNDDKDLFLNIWHRFKYIIEHNSDYIGSYTLRIQFNVRNEYAGNVTSVNYNYDDPDDECYKDTIEDVVKELYDDVHLIVSLRHFVDFVPAEVSFRRFSRQVNYLVRAIGPKLPTLELKEAIMGLLRLDKKDLVYTFMSKRSMAITQSTMSDLYRKIFEDKSASGLNMNPKYDERYTSRYYSYKHTHLQNFLVYLRDNPKIYNGFVVWSRGEKLMSHKDEYYQVYLKIQGDPNINLPENVRVRTTDEIIDLVRDNILPQFNKKD